MKRTRSANAAAAAAGFSLESGEVFGGSTRKDRTAAGEDLHKGATSHYVLDQIDRNAIELERWIQTTDSFTNSKAELKKERARK